MLHKMLGQVAGYPIVVALASVLLLTACAETQLAVHLAKEVKSTSRQETLPSETERATGVRKIGRPYQVNGVWYYPHENPDYDETGIASWYGDPFHGRLTANGERYDMNALTAAHKTLPLPTDVRVTNLDNGRSIVVRVNDRGPFVNGRIIDLSRRSAQLLGFQRQGTAKVRVQLAVSPPAVTIAEKAKTPPEQKQALPAVPRGNVAAQQLPPPPGAKEAQPRQLEQTARVASADDRVAVPTATREAAGAVPEEAQLRQLIVEPSSIFVQAGAFSQAENANRLRARLSWIGPSRITNIVVKGQEIFRVRIGPLPSVGDADGVLRQVLGEGIMDAHIIVN